ESRSLSLRPIGTLIICIDLDTLIEQTSIFHSAYYNAPSILLLQDGKAIYCPENISEKNLETLSHKSHNGYMIRELDAQTFFIVQSYIEDYNWDYIAMVSYESISRTISITTAGCITAIL